MLVGAVLPPARRPAHRSCEAFRIPLPTTVAASANSTNARSCVQLAGKLPVGGQRHPQVHQSRASHIVQRGQKHVHADRCRIRRQYRLLCCQVGRNINSKPTSTRQHTVPERGPRPQPRGKRHFWCKRGRLGRQPVRLVLRCQLRQLQQLHDGPRLRGQRDQCRLLVLRMCDRHGRRQGRPHCQCGRHTSKVVHRHPYDLALQLRSFQLDFQHPPPRSCIVTPASPIRLLLVDDHAILREGLAALLASMDGLEVVGQAGDGATALDMYRDLQPDVVICDLRMVPMDGTEFTAAVRAEYPSARVILLTTYDTDEEVFRGLRAGAASYVLKDVAPAQLVETVQAVHAGRKAIDPAIAAKLAEHVASDGLTARQLEVLQCLAEGRSNLEIASTLYISEGTVKAHIKAIFQKLGARDRTQAVTIGIKRGFIRGL